MTVGWEATQNKYDISTTKYVISTTKYIFQLNRNVGHGHFGAEQNIDQPLYIYIIHPVGFWGPELFCSILKDQAGL